MQIMSDAGGYHATDIVSKIWNRLCVYNVHAISRYWTLNLEVSTNLNLINATKITPGGSSSTYAIIPVALANHCEKNPNKNPHLNLASGDYMPVHYEEFDGNHVIENRYDFFLQ